tara:strand:+ start:5023 stop:6813 length:1791 start_codon:yes stop_codon:yes gene_type:complete
MQKLQEKGIILRNYNVGQHKTKCPECKDQRKKKNNHDEPLSITIESGGGAVWNCHNCEWHGGISGKIYERRDQKPFKRPIKKIVEKPIPKFYEWFIKRAISSTTVDHFGLYRDEHYVAGSMQPCIVFPYKKDDHLINNKYRTSSKQFGQEAGAERTLFNIDAVKAHWETSKIKEIIFVEGEMDVLALHEAGYPFAVSLPDGAPKEAKFEPDDKRFKALETHPWLEAVEKVIIAVDTDGPGQALAQELVHRFGSDRCWSVDWPNLNDVDCKDANDSLMFHGAEVTAECVQLAKPYPIDGLYQASDYKMDVLDIYHHRIQQPISTGYSSLDEKYMIMPGTFHLVTGVPNHGKSTFVDQLAVNLAKNEGWKFAIFSPEHSVAQHIRRLSEKIVEKPFDVGLNKRMTEKELLWATDKIDEHFCFIENGDTAPTIDWILDKARAACFRRGIRGVIIDPYNEIDAVRKSGVREDEHIRDLISKCKQFCRRHNVVIWMVAHPAKMSRDDAGKLKVPTLYDVSGAAHWYNMADVGLTVHREFSTEKTVVHVQKIREQGLYGQIGECEFRFDTNKRVYEEENGDTRPNSNKMVGWVKTLDDRNTA